MQLRTPFELGLLIRKARRSRGMTQQQLASAVGVGRQWIVALEAGKPRVQLDKVLQTLAALDLSLSIHGEGVSAPSGVDVGIDVPDIEAVLEAHRDPPP